MPSTEWIVARHDPCLWLPKGGVAEVVAVSNGSAVPFPTPVVRLLVTAADAILAVPRADGRGLDIPTAEIGDSIESTLGELLSSTLDGEDPRLIGFVRNTVTEDPSGEYHWPIPVAHFVVWHCETHERAVHRGQWLDPNDAEAHLSERHWWPLVHHR